MATKTSAKSKAPAKTKTTTAKATSAGRRKSTTAPKTTRASSAAPAAPVSAPAPTQPDVAAAEAMRRPDLIQAVADRVSLKRSEAKMVFDVVLDEIGKALDKNEDVIIPPLGKLMVKKRMEKPGGQMLTLKLKRAEADPTAGDVAPLAKPSEEG